MWAGVKRYLAGIPNNTNLSRLDERREQPKGVQFWETPDQTPLDDWGECPGIFSRVERTQSVYATGRAPSQEVNPFRQECERTVERTWK